MKKILSTVFLLAMLTTTGVSAQQLQVSGQKNSKQMKETIYQFRVKDIAGNDFDFGRLEGKKIMIVNTASECGLTPQYRDLQYLHETYKDRNLVIIAFPANDFMGQEPGNNTEIATFCQKNYGVKFPIMSKISVTGPEMHELYKFLTQKSRNGLEDSEVKWNFQKYLINEKGELEKVIAPKTLPTDSSVINWIEGKQ
ncbi:MAG TPA: glutathione peroxidase [Flavobacterium sp.]|jgi:glutathione peroxidase